MYYPNDIEEICYEQEHINKVFLEISSNIPAYFQKYIDSEGGYGVTYNEIEKLASALGASLKPKSKAKDNKKILEKLLKEAKKDFESDRSIYREILHPGSLAEYKSDVGSFKNTVLKNQIPIIRKTLKNRKAKELDKYRASFNVAQPGNLFEVVKNIIMIAEEWRHKWYKEKEFEQINNCDDLGYYDLDEKDYTAYGVIGGGIKSHFIYKLYPEMYPNRSQEAIWALWYLSNKKSFDCEEDSEFLMINTKESTTQQNYFYPYGLFAFYALNIFNNLKSLYASHGIGLDVKYRFVVVDNFLSFIARQNQDDINLLKQKSADYHYDY